MKTLQPDGFSFLELMLVMFIVSIFSAIVLPKFNNYLASGSLSQAGKMSDLLSYINDQATMSKNENVLSIDLDKKIATFNSAGRVKIMAFPGLKTVSLMRGEITEGIALIAVSSWGMQQPFRICFTDNMNVATVDFNPVTAKTVILRRAPEAKEKILL